MEQPTPPAPAGPTGPPAPSEPAGPPGPPGSTGTFGQPAPTTHTRPMAPGETIQSQFPQMENPDMDQDQEMMEGAEEQEEKPDKEKYVVDRKATIKVVEMPEEMQEEIIQLANDTLDVYYVDREVAAVMRSELDERYGKSWHVIVGVKFGGFCTHENDRLFYFYLGQVGFFLFKME